jgi:hypothetical protein
MVAISTSALTKDTGTRSYNTNLISRKVDATLLLLAFLAIAANVAWILRKHRISIGRSRSHATVKNLLFGVLVALPFVIVRLMYTAVY